MSELKYGDLCQVRDHDENEWQERIFILTAKDGRALCVYNNNTLAHFERFSDNSTWWHECRQIPQKKFMPYDYDTIPRGIYLKRGNGTCLYSIERIDIDTVKIDGEYLFYKGLLEEYLHEDGSPAGLEETEYDSN